MLYINVFPHDVSEDNKYYF